MLERGLQPGWKRVKFGEIAESVNDRVDDPRSAGVERYVGLEHLDSDDLKIRRWGTPTDVEATKLRFRAGDIIFGRRRAYQRKLALADFDGICSAHALVLREKLGLVTPGFLPFFMQSDAFMQRAVAISVGSLSPTINWTTLRDEQFLLPPLEAQRRMRDAFHALQTTRQAAAHALNVADQVRRAKLLNWFRPGRGSTDSFPAHWTLATVGEAGDTQVGIRKHPGSLHGLNMRPYLRVANVLDGRIDWSNILEIEVPPAERERCALRDGDILVNKGNSIELVGRAAIYRSASHSTCYFQDHLLRFRPSDMIAPEFAHAYFQHLLYSLHFTKIAVASTSIATMPLDLFKKLPLPIPPGQEQKAMVEEITALANAMTLLERRNETIGHMSADFGRQYLAEPGL